MQSISCFSACKASNDSSEHSQGEFHDETFRTAEKKKSLLSKCYEMLNPKQNKNRD